jgi:hypothetical protein
LCGVYREIDGTRRGADFAETKEVRMRKLTSAALVLCLSAGIFIAGNVPVFAVDLSVFFGWVWM